MRTALLTGISGYLGSHVGRCLISRGWRVVALARHSSEIADDLQAHVIRVEYDGSLSSVMAALAQAPIDIVVHLASAVIAHHTLEQLDPLLDANIRLPTQLLEGMRNGDCKYFLNTGTFWQYCNSESYMPVNLYAATKGALEALAASYVANDGIHFRTLVLFDNFGSDDYRRKIMNILIDAVGAKQTVPLSPGMQVLDLTHVDDVATAFAVSCEDRQNWNASIIERYRVSGDRLTLRDLVERVKILAGQAPNVHLGARPYRNREIMVPIEEEIPLLPNWTRHHDLTAEIRNMLALHTSAAPDT